MKPTGRLLGLAIVAVLAAGCSTAAAEAPPPTPQIIIKTIEVPGPQPTPQIITKTIEVPVVPPACRAAIDNLLGTNKITSGFLLDVLNAYLDYPDEDLGEFGGRVENLLGSLSEAGLPDLPELDLTPCLGTNATGTTS